MTRNPETTEAARTGDVVRYVSERPNRWCREEMAVRHDDGRLVDTYWSSGGDSHTLTEAEAATARLLFNVGDYNELDRWSKHVSEAVWRTYAPADRQVITSQHGLERRWFIRRGARPDHATQVANATEAVEEARRLVESAQSSLEWRLRELAAIDPTAVLAVSPAVTEGERASYHPDPTINAEVVETANEAERADLAAGYPPRMWRCPQCGTEHGRGHHLAIGQHRCLHCGYVGAGGVMFGSNPSRSDTSRHPSPAVTAAEDETWGREKPHTLTRYGTTNCPVEGVRAAVDDGECSACGAPVVAAVPAEPNEED